MFFLRAVPVPTKLKYKGVEYLIPKFTIADAVQWGKDIQDLRDTAATAGMEDVASREFKAFYPSIPPDLNQLKKMLRTVEGTKKIIEVCLSRTALFAELATILEANGSGRLDPLAAELSGFFDDAKIDPGPDENPTSAAAPSQKDGSTALPQSPVTGQ